MWGLHEYAVATGDERAPAAARRAAESLLERRLFRRRGTGARGLPAGEAVHRSWVVLHYPVYWHYDILQGLLVLSRMGLAGDERCSDALDVLERRRLPDGRWRPGGYWWRITGERAREVVDWAAPGPTR